MRRSTRPRRVRAIAGERLTPVGEVGWRTLDGFLIDRWEGSYTSAEARWSLVWPGGGQARLHRTVRSALDAVRRWRQEQAR